MTDFIVNTATGDPSQFNVKGDMVFTEATKGCIWKWGIIGDKVQFMIYPIPEVEQEFLKLAKGMRENTSNNDKYFSKTGFQELDFIQTEYLATTLMVDYNIDLDREHEFSLKERQELYRVIENDFPLYKTTTRKLWRQVK